MLKLVNISKVYKINKQGEKDFQIVDALKNVSIEFRKSEFVSILGPSGCGKTTLLNIIGGLDQYTDGDLIINGKSTKLFKDSDWDTYRNHRVGFVFQSYNLIPHLNVLQNVELALTLSGVNSEERKRRATEVLEKVGLSDKLHSRPNQLSGGQMQRVAIARALVNDPEIILADEPTGALDSKTSIQIMELLKEISNERLIVMVTHNPELANDYSTRIIKLFDGSVEGDSMPYHSDEEINQVEEIQNIQKTKEKQENSKSKKHQQEVQRDENQENVEDIVKKTKDKKTKDYKSQKKRMSFFMALSLSLKNLLTKKARTFLVSFAGSIGIIGIALILALSSGFQGYINTVQEDTLSTYPLTISSATMDYGALFDVMMSENQENEEKAEDGLVKSDDIIVSMFQSVLSGSKTNDLKSFKAFLDGEGKEQIEPYITAVQYTYNLKLNVYDNATETQLNPNNMFYNGVMAWLQGMALKQLAPTPEYKALQNQYAQSHDITNANAISAITFEQMMSDSTIAPNLAGLVQGAVTQLISTITGAMNGGSSGGGIGSIMGGGNGFESLQNSDLGLWTEMINNPTLINSQYNVVATEAGVNKETLIENLAYNEVVLVLDREGFLSDYALYALGIKTSPTIEEIAGGLVDSENYVIEPFEIEYNQIVGKTYTLLAETDYFVYKSKTDATDYKLQIESTQQADYTLVDIREELKEKTINQNKFDEIVASIKEQNGTELRIKGILSPKSEASATSINGSIGYSYKLTQHLSNKIDNAITAKGETTLGAYKVNLDSPATISFYCTDFESKGELEKIIAAYNASVDEEKQIEYSDYIGIMMSSISTIINAISYVLIAFVSISLIVSSIMIGIITYISVLERTKEIGVLRSIGASKRDIKRVFTAESIIIGFASGMLGIIITLILTIPINIIINSLAGIGGVASLPWLGGISLVLISMLLTFIAGLIPARIASKKDPVIALRSE